MKSTTHPGGVVGKHIEDHDEEDHSRQGDEVARRFQGHFRYDVDDGAQGQQHADDDAEPEEGHVIVTLLTSFIILGRKYQSKYPIWHSDRIRF